MNEASGLVNYWKATNAAESLDLACPMDIWVEDRGKPLLLRIEDGREGCQ